MPILGVPAPRHPAVIGAEVPKAAVNEDRYFLLWEHDVRTDSTIARLQTMVLPKSKTLSMEQRPQLGLGLGVGPPVPLHRSRHCR